MPGGYWGKILRVDLSNNRVDVEEQGDSFYRRYFGGMGVDAHYLLSELKAGVDPLGPDNVLVFAPGVITGVPLAGTGRNSVGAKSPMSGAFGRSEVGGFLGAELKRAGFDAIVIQGRAEHPVYLWVHDGEAEIRDARHLWGKETKESQAAIQAELGDKMIRTAQIGPGGEQLVRFACVINDLRHAAGRTGMGAVMGSKNLKAVAARGRLAVPLADPETVKAFSKRAVENIKKYSKSLSDFGTGVGQVGATLAGNLPTRNFRDGYFEHAGDIGAEAIREKIRVGMEGCFACSVRCKKVVEVKEAFYEADPIYGGPEYETFAAVGSNCGVSDLRAIARAHHLCQAYSLDTISTGATVAFAMECFENGLITAKDTDGLELRFGDGEAMVKAVEMIARREGFGDVLAEGTKRAAATIGGGAEKYSMAVKGVELGMHEPRLKFGLGLGFCVVPHGGDHNAPGIQDTLYEKDGRPMHLAHELGWLEPIAANDLSARKVGFFRDLNHWRAFNDCAVMCALVPWDAKEMSELVAAVTGWDTSVHELLKVGERAVTMARIFNMREGFSRADDVLPERFFSPPTAGALADKKQAVDREQMERAKTFYYSLMGWDPATGVPTVEKLETLGIGHLGAALENLG
ncbi:MAG: aldehyde ferredoxin oxidoreductase family protein [Chloroflexota bacterium]